MAYIFPVETVGKCRVQGPVITGWGDCRTCSLVISICAEDEDKKEWCRLKESICCLKCPHTIKCLDCFVEEVWCVPRENVKEFCRAFFGCSELENIKEGISRIKKRLNGHGR